MNTNKVKVLVIEDNKELQNLLRLAGQHEQDFVFQFSDNGIFFTFSL